MKVASKIKVFRGNPSGGNTFEFSDPDEAKAFLKGQIQSLGTEISVSEDLETVLSFGYPVEKAVTKEGNKITYKIGSQYCGIVIPEVVSVEPETPEVDPVTPE